MPGEFDISTLRFVDLREQLQQTEVQILESSMHLCQVCFSINVIKAALDLPLDAVITGFRYDTQHSRVYIDMHTSRSPIAPEGAEIPLLRLSDLS